MNKSRQKGRPLKDRIEAESVDLQLVTMQKPTVSLGMVICWTLREHGPFNALIVEIECPNSSRIDFWVSLSPSL